ncbi:hypothetical protein PS682_01882 [Pseudomonas fluorescens]|nr:hypothetical protein PS682_01882 [Pseudomonas fluorescens]
MPAIITATPTQCSGLICSPSPSHDPSSTTTNTSELSGNAKDRLLRRRISIHTKNAPM